MHTPLNERSQQFLLRIWQFYLLQGHILLVRKEAWRIWYVYTVQTCLPQPKWCVLCIQFNLYQGHYVYNWLQSRVLLYIRGSLLPPPPMLVVGGLARLVSSAICYPQTNPPTPFVSAWSGGLVGGRNTLVITAPDNPICPHSCQPLVSLSLSLPSSRPQYVPVDAPPKTVVVTYWQLPVDSHFVCNH